MAKYRVGQKVKIRLDLIPKSSFGEIWVNPLMIKYCGNEYTIHDVQVFREQIIYHFEEIPWNWEEGMLCPQLFKNFVHLNNYI